MPDSKNPKKVAPIRRRVKQKTDYEKCKKNIIGQDMRLFKQGKLKQRNKQPVKNRKQAIAIALSMAEHKCKNKKTRSDVRRENKKMRLKLSQDNQRALTSSDARRIIAKLKDLKQKKRSREYRTLKIHLLTSIVMTPTISPALLRDIRRYLRNH